MSIHINREELQCKNSKIQQYLKTKGVQENAINSILGLLNSDNSKIKNDISYLLDNGKIDDYINSLRGDLFSILGLEDLNNDNKNYNGIRDIYNNIKSIYKEVDKCEKDFSCKFILLKVNIDEVFYYLGCESYEEIIDYIGEIIGSKIGGNVYRIDNKHFGFIIGNEYEDSTDFNNDDENFIIYYLNQIINNVKKTDISYDGIEINLFLTASIVFIDDSNKYEVIKNGFKALNKNNNSISIYQDNKHNLEKENNLINISKIENGLENEEKAEFEPFIQRIINSDGKIKFEVLSRLKDKENDKFLDPSFFLNYIDKTGNNRKFTDIVLNKLFNYISQIPEKDRNNYEFSINLSQDDIDSSNFYDFFVKKLNEYNINPNNLVLEILEDVEINEERRYWINELRKLGCKTAIDDFGISYSNIYRLVEDFDYLKIDKSLIFKMFDDIKIYNILKLIIYMAQQNNKKIIAEGVENEATVEELKRLGVYYFQGFYYGKPKPFDLHLKE